MELKKDMDCWTPTVRALFNQRFAEIICPTTIKEIIEIGQPMVVIENIVGRETLLLAIEIELAKTSAMINVDSRLNLQSHQVPIIAQELYTAFKTESIQDFMLCFKRGSTGLYDALVLRLDGAVIFGWMKKYLEEKYSLFEAKVLESKNEEKENVVDYDLFKKRMADSQIQNCKIKDEFLRKEKERQLRDLEFSERRKEYASPSDDKIVKRELHLQWIRENHNPISGSKVKEYLSEEDWLAKINRHE